MHYSDIYTYYTDTHILTYTCTLGSLVTSSKIVDCLFMPSLYLSARVNAFAFTSSKLFDVFIGPVIIDHYPEMGAIMGW